LVYRSKSGGDWDDFDDFGDAGSKNNQKVIFQRTISIIAIGSFGLTLNPFLTAKIIFCPT